MASVGGAPNQTERRHVYKETVGAPTFKSGTATVAATVSSVDIASALQCCLVTSNAASLQQLCRVLQQCWLSAPPARGGVDEVLQWHHDCDAVLALLYATLAARTVANNLLLQHLALFLAKWFNNGDIMKVALTLQPAFKTERFIAIVLLHALLLPTESSSHDTQQLLEWCETSQAFAAVESPVWLQQVVGVEDALQDLVASLRTLLQFNYSVPRTEGSTPGTTLRYLLATVERYQAGSYCSGGHPDGNLPDIEGNPAIEGCLVWLNGVMAAEKGKLVLAAAELRTALAIAPSLAPVLYSAYVVYKRRGCHETSLQCLQLLLRACEEQETSPPCLPYTAALLATLCPLPPRRALQALVAVACLKAKKWKEANNVFTELIAGNHLVAPATDDVTAATRRHLLLSRDRPPSFPALPVLLTQAAIAAFRLHRPDDLAKLFSTHIAESRDRQYYSSAPEQQLETVSLLMLSVLRLHKHVMENSRSQAKRDCVRLTEATCWVSHMSESCTETAIHPLLLLAPILIKALVATHLARLHVVVATELEGRQQQHQRDSVRCFNRLREQSLASAEKICLQGSGDAVIDNKADHKVRLVHVDDVAVDVDEVLPNNSPVKSTDKLCNLVIVLCDNDHWIPGLDETCTISLRNINMYLIEEIYNENF